MFGYQELCMFFMRPWIVNTCVCLHLFAIVYLLTYLHVGMLPARDLVVSSDVMCILCILYVYACSYTFFRIPWSLKTMNEISSHVPSCTSWILLAQLVPGNHQFRRATRPMMACHGNQAGGSAAAPPTAGVSLHPQDPGSASPENSWLNSWSLSNS